MNAADKAHNTLLARYRARLQDEQADITRRFCADHDLSALLQARSQRIDAVLCDLWRDLEMPASLALIAVGGYGREQLYPYSDIDLLFLLPEPPEAALADALERLIRLLWDIGLTIGHSVRTPEECLEEAANDLTIQTALIDARLLTGDLSLFARLQRAFQQQINLQAFFHGKCLEQKERHLRYHESPYSLEPNCKESPGGLRDLQMILWLAQAAGFGKNWKALQEHGLISREEQSRLEMREAFLQRLRIELHLLARRQEDRLLFDHQTAVAERMGFVTTQSLRASEQLMQRYYQTAKVVTQINAILLQTIGAAIFPLPPHPPSPINAWFQETDQFLDVVDENVFKRSPEAILEAFLVMAQRPGLRGMTARMIRALWRARTQVDERFRADPGNRARFLALFRQEHGVLHELRRMNQFGILGRYLPNFGEIVGRMQYDLFHAYTVDQHTLLVLRNLRRFLASEFAHEYPFCSQLISNFDKPWLLYIAALFHDIAKGRGGDHSALGAADAQTFCREHGLDAADSELIVWLVRDHLLMSNVAQKKDTTDPDVIAGFAAAVRNERRLTALYLLTVADIRATSPKVWNSWKGQLLEELYRLTVRALRAGGQLPPRQGWIQEKQDEAKRLMRAQSIPDTAHEVLWAQLDTVYFLRHSPAEIAWHTCLLHERIDSQQPIVKARRHHSGAGIEIAVYTRDADDLFLRIVGFFSRAGFNIMDAKIHTTRHGYALDSFILLDFSEREMSIDELLERIEHQLAAQLASNALPKAPPTVRPSRQVRHFPIQPAITIQPDDKGQSFILSVSATDRPGLLYTVAETLAEHGANLHTAKIATLGERVEDTFLISGGDITDSANRIRLETELLDRLKR